MNIRTIMCTKAYEEKLKQHRLDDNNLAHQLRELDERDHALSDRAPNSSKSNAELPRPPPRLA